MHATRTARKALGVSAVVMASTLALGAAASGVAAPSAKPRPVAAGTPGTIVFECFQVDRGPDPNAVVLAQTQNFGNDTVIVRRAVRVCEPALKLRDNPDPAAGTIQILPNATLTLGSDAGAPTVSMDGAIAMLRESPTTPAGGKVLASSMQGGGMVADSFFDVFLELAAVGNWQLDSFFDITYRMSATGGTAGPQSSDVSLHLVSQGPGLYSGPLPTPVTIGGAKFTNATLTLNDPTATNGTAATRVMECFRTEKGADPNDPYLLTTNNFGRDPVLVRQASTLCEGALKTKEPIQPGTTTTVSAPFVAWECFRIASGQKPNTTFRFVTNNFGLQSARVQRAVELCEDARKVRTDAAGNVTAVGRPTGHVYECFRLEARNQKAPFWLTNRNFGGAPVVIRSAVLMCETAKKEPLNTFPPPNDRGDNPGD